MTQSHYSLRWNNHQNHILAAFEALLEAETLVDVTLVCGETSVRAHKVVLSACSPLFQRIFSENPCKHPVIVLQDFSGWEVQAIVDFMYKGEISVIQEQLQSLIKAAESLQVRGLANQDQFVGIDKDSILNPTPTPTPLTSPHIINDFEKSYFGNRFPTPGITVRSPADHRSSPSLPPPPPHFTPLPYESSIKLPHMPRLSFPESLLPRQESQSPIPRRKQARPRRRSGEFCGPQDLSKPTQLPTIPSIPSLPSLPPISTTSTTTTSSSSSSSSSLPTSQPTIQSPIQQQQQQQQHHQQHQQHQHQQLPIPAPPPPSISPIEEIAENLCLKRVKIDDKLSLPPLSQTPQPDDMKIQTPTPSGSPEMDLTMPISNKEFRTSPPVSLPPTMSMKQDVDSHSPLPFPPMPSVSALAMTPPHIFGLDSPLGLFPPSLDACRNPLFDMTDPRTTPDTQIFAKKKMGRPKGQHSAPRGGPPRSWTNAELTEALQHVWNKKMTTSQASRIFGIPYNSLLMYVRGKYGKSLKLEQLRKDCIAGPNPSLDILNIGGSTNNNNNNNNNIKSERDSELQQQQQQQQQQQSNTRPSSTEEQQHQAPPPPPPPSVFNPFVHNFYPDFGTGFPIPVSMIHLLPQSEKIRDHFGSQQTAQDDGDCKDVRVKKEYDEADQDHLYRSTTQSLASVVDDRRELLQQNGQD